MNRVLSGPVAVSCCVPWGDMLRPIKFVSYTEDVNTVFHWHQVRYHLYADDKQAYTDVPVDDVSRTASYVAELMYTSSLFCVVCSHHKMRGNTSQFQDDAFLLSLIWLYAFWNNMHHCWRYLLINEYCFNDWTRNNYFLCNLYVFSIVQLSIWVPADPVTYI